MLTRKVDNFLRDEHGGGTVMGLFWFMVILAFCGMTVDTTTALRNKTGMQAAADAAVLAASIDLPNVNAARANALLYTEINMPSSRYGDLLLPEDIEFGIWEPETRSYIPTEILPNAVRVKLNRERGRGNQLGLSFLSIIGLDAWDDIAVEAIAYRFIPPCLHDGLFARKKVDISSNNNFVEKICVHGEEEVAMQNHNYYEDGVTVSMPDPDTMLTLPEGGFENNPGLQQALRANSYDFSVVDDLPEIFYRLLHPDEDTGEFSVVPDYVSGDPKSYDVDYTVEGLSSSDLSKMGLETGFDGMLVDEGNQSTAFNISGIPTDKGEKEIWEITCKSTESYNIPSGIVLTNIVIVAQCRIHVGSGAVLNNVILASTAIGNGSKWWEYQNITFASNVQLGDHDNCAPGGGVQIFSAASVHFSSSMMINGLQVVARGDVELGAGDQAIKGITVVAGENVTLTSNNIFGSCCGGSPSTQTEVSYRLVY